jgi:group I intron endonuclease
MTVGIIYGLSLDGHTFRYVGMTKRTLEARMRGHRDAARYGSQNPVYHWIRKYGFENVIATVLSYAEIDDLKSAERWWIAELRNLGYSLLNLTDGGEGNLGWVPSEETRRRIGDANRGRLKGRKPTRVYGPISEEHRTAVGAAHRGVPGYWAGRTQSVESNEKRRQALLGRPGPNKGKVAANKGKSMSQEQKDKISATKRARRLAT